MNTPLIGIFGQKRHGKSTVARMLQEKLNADIPAVYDTAPPCPNPFTPRECPLWQVVGFADRLKRVLSQTTNMSLRMIEHYKLSNLPPPGWKLTVRQALQNLGECMRNVYPTVWIDAIGRGYLSSTPLIIPDGRYHNEAKMLHDRGSYNILVCRQSEINMDYHTSESEMGRYYGFYQYQPSVIINGVVEYPYKPVFPSCESPLDLIDTVLYNDDTLADLDARVDHLVSDIQKHFNKEASNV